MTQKVQESKKLLAKAYINGQWEEGAGESIEKISPVTGKVLGTYTYGTKEQVELAIKSAKEAQKEWANMSIMDKADLFKRAEEIGNQYGEEISRLVTLEMGKPITEARQEVYDMGIENFGLAMNEMLRFKGTTLPSTFERSKAKKIMTVHEPLGVISVITPWNYPVSLTAEYIPYALAAGNTVVFKPSELTPFSTALYIKIFEEAGFPPGVVNIVHGAGDVGHAMVSDERVDCVAFTGSTDVGVKISNSIGMKRSIFELGGMGPLIVMEDANIEAAVEAAVDSTYHNAGQVCTAAERILIHENIYDEFLDKLVERVKKIKVGNPLEEDTEMGTMSGQPVIDKVNTHIKDAVSKGAEVILGGNQNEMYFEPTIIKDVTEDMLMAQEETFGPVACIMKFSTREEAIEIANNTKYGLTSSVFTSSLEDSWYMAENIVAGTVHINECTNYWDFLAPFGGAKSSGRGRILGSWVMEAFTEVKQISFDISKVKRK